MLYYIASFNCVHGCITLKNVYTNPNSSTPRESSTFKMPTIYDPSLISFLMNTDIGFTEGVIVNPITINIWSACVLCFEIYIMATYV